MSDDDDRDTLKILVATDNHLGVWEKDEIRKDDSFITFEEILQIAQQQAVDLVLLGGDLFHDNKPSRSTIVRAIDILTRYTLSDKPVAFQVVSDQSVNFVSRRVNFENSNLNVGLPVFTIHGNHDDPAGADNLSAVDVLSTCNLVNYFGKAALSGSGVGKIRIEPVLLKKGNTKVGIYGLGNVRDERLGRMFQTPGCVEWARPASSPDCPQNEWFNVFVLHQNRVPHSQNAKNCIRESYLARFLDFVIWGHEHECIPESWVSSCLRQDISTQGIPNQAVVSCCLASAGEHAASEDKSFSLIQPGSSVATALSEGESKRKHVVLFEINRERYRTINFPLESVRPFLHDNVTLQDHVEVAGEDSEAITAFLENKVEYMIQKANSRAVGGRDTMLPLIRLRVDYTGFSTINAQRFGQKFVGKVANPHDILLWHKAPVRKAKAPGEVSENASLTDGIRPEALDERQIEDLIAEHLQQHLEILPEQDLANALHNFVDKDEKQALHDCVRAALAETQTAAVADRAAGATGPEGDVDAAVNAQIQHRRNQQSAQATTASAARILPSGPSDASLPQPNGIAAMDEDDDMSVPRPSSSRPASAGQGRASSRPPTAPESARGRQATLGEAFGRSGRSTQQGESSTRTARSPAPRGRRGRGASTPAATPTPRRGATRQTAQQAAARMQQHASSEDLEPSGSDAAEDLIDEIEEDDDDVISLMDEDEPVAAGRKRGARPPLAMTARKRGPGAGSQAPAGGGGFIADSDDEAQAAPPVSRAGRRRALGASQRSGLPLSSQPGTSQLTAKSWGAPR
ncbi:TPA: hypothetical protein ACH3X2_000030 [Trebouxia sp. C0005]